MQVTIGVDIGNYDTKTANTRTVSGYSVYDNEQLLAETVLFYDGKYYIESIDDRLPYVEDKTENDQCLILTLFAIAKEIMFRVRKDGRGRSMQEAIASYTVVNLALGLPPGHFNKLARKTRDYYYEAMGKGISFKYANYEFIFKLGYLEIYAQDLTAVLVDSGLSFTNTKSDDAIPKYYIIGIGGYTVDIIPITVTDGKPVPVIDMCRSLPMGTRPMYEQIITKLQSSSGYTLNEQAIEDVLRGKRHFLPQEVVDEIRSNAKTHADQIIDRCIQAGCTLNIYPVAFVGGGCLLLQPWLDANKKMCHVEYINDVRANAINYEKFIIAKHKLSG